MVLFEGAGSLWSGASATGEGKVHLGAVYALGDRATRTRMLGSGLRFAPILESVLERRLDWDSLCSDEFIHLVAPTSLSSAPELRQRYAEINRGLREVSPASYLGRSIDFVVDTDHRPDPVTGLPAFRCSERSVDPLRLGTLLCAAAKDHPLIEIRAGAEVVRVDRHSGEVTTFTARDGDRRSEPFEAVMNCTWERRQAIEQASGVTGLAATNLRVKAAVLLEPEPGDRSVTLVQGPFGDVVAHSNFTYASWYPVARRHLELSSSPSADAIVACRQADKSTYLARRQQQALASLGLLDPRAQVIGHGAGFILGEGAADIDSPTSRLHSRANQGCRIEGRLVTPLNYKFSSAPQAAIEACEAVLPLTSV